MPQRRKQAGKTWRGEPEAGAPAVNRRSKNSGQDTSRGKEGADPTGGSPASACTVGHHVMATRRQGTSDPEPMTT